MKTDWHKFPEQEPPRFGEYLVTVKGQGKVRAAEWGLWSRKEMKFIGKWQEVRQEYVAAWTEMPEPYKEVSQ